MKGKESPRGIKNQSVEVAGWFGEEFGLEDMGSIGGESVDGDCS